MDEKLEQYLHEDDSRKKSELYKDLINKNTETLTKEQETDNLLHFAFEPIDISQKTMQTLETIDEFDQGFSANVMQTINKRERNKTVIWIISGIAAIIALSLVLMNLNSMSHYDSQNNHAQSNGDKGLNSPEIQEVIVLPEGVRITVFKNSKFEVLKEEKAYLELKTGKMRVEVESRKGKTPLLFHMPHGTVKVIGTVFNLECNAKESSVDVIEGRIEFIHNEESINIMAGETGNSNGLSLTKSIEQNLSVQRDASIYSFDNLEQFKTEGNPKLTKGYVGSGIKLDGKSSIIIDRKENSSSETFSLWLKAEMSDVKTRVLICQHDKFGSYNGFNIFLVKNRLKLQLKNQTDSLKNMANKKIELNKWHHVAFTRNVDGQFKYYLNGECIAEGNFPFTYKTSELRIGKSQNTWWSPFIGIVDELRIFPRSLSEAEIYKISQER